MATIDITKANARVSARQPDILAAMRGEMDRALERFENGVLKILAQKKPEAVSAERKIEIQNA
jgi:HSP20 family molecular chaperone IbpA